LGNGFWPKVKADVIFNPEEYIEDFEAKLMCQNL